MYINILLHINIFTDCNISAHICHFFIDLCWIPHIFFRTTILYLYSSNVGFFVSLSCVWSFCSHSIAKMIIFFVSFRFVFVPNQTQYNYIDFFFSIETHLHILFRLYIISSAISFSFWIDLFLLSLENY